MDPNKKLPKEHVLLICTCTDGKDYHLGYDKDRGFFEPITNIDASEMNLTVRDWFYMEDIR